MTDYLKQCFAVIHGINSRLTIGGGVLLLVIAGQGLLAYLQPFA